MGNLGWVLLCLWLSLMGCAHRSTTGDGATGVPPASAATQAVPVYLGLAQAQAAPVGDEFSDENLAFLDELAQEAPLLIADPLAPWNRAMFHFNDKLYYWLLKPLAQGYRTVVPGLFRTGFQNFFHNLATPIRLAGCILQGKGRAAGAELGNFMINTTFGVLGFGNLTRKVPELNPDEEDLGQTLGAYGIGNGFYIVWPFLGPSTLRDSIGFAGDRFLNPTSYVNPFSASAGITAFRIVNDTSFRIGDYEAIKDAAIEPYEAFRDAYIQFRQKKVRD